MSVTEDSSKIVITSVVADDPNFFFGSSVFALSYPKNSFTPILIFDL